MWHFQKGRCATGHIHVDGNLVYVMWVYRITTLLTCSARNNDIYKGVICGGCSAVHGIDDGSSLTSGGFTKQNYGHAKDSG